ncbi:MAG: hypothetical protein HYS12_15700 [Planctomycetes bacterium]|nr:hypothetical protein [Planctomycetota bacterium]
MISLYALRFLIIQKNRRATDALAWYCLALAVFVPAIWLLVVTNWDSMFFARIACWVGDPIALLFVPSVLFPFYLSMRPSLTLGIYTLLSMAEIVLLVPAWIFFWVQVEFWVLGWAGV